MRQKRHTVRAIIMPILMGMLMSLGIVAVSPGIASADAPTIKWGPVDVGNIPEFTTSATGSTIVGCSWTDSGNDLTAYSQSGAVIQQLDRTQQIDGVGNCITKPAVDKNGDVYGVPFDSFGTAGPNLLAYANNTLKWKYPVQCSTGGYSTVIGGDGNVYTTSQESDGIHLVGLAPDLAMGQTQPTVVTDIVIDSGCGTRMFAYKDGVVIRQTSSGAPYRYFSYSGKYLGQAPTASYGGTAQDAESIKFNDNGRMFAYVTSGGNGAITAYDPSTGTGAWSYPLITNTAVGSIHTVSDGGIVLALDEPAMVAPGIPESPPRTISKLVGLNSLGQKVADIELSSSLGTGYGNWGRVAVDTGGNAAVLTSGAYQDSQSHWHSYITLRRVDVVAETIDSTFTLGDYALQTEELHTLEITNDTVVFMGACYALNACTGASGGKRLFALELDGIGMQYPRGAVLSAGPRPTASYVALGDSFSSGEGVEPFEANTDLPEVNTCHRSTTAYPQLIAGTSANIPSLGTGGFRACSGAVTTNITDLAQWNEGIQLDWWPDTTTQLVTLTIGGNDIGFGNTIETCAWPLNDCDAAFQTAGQKAANIGDILESTYTRALTTMPNAQVYVIGYPPMFAAGTGCVVGPNQTDYPFYTEARKQKAIDLLAALNDKISTSVGQVQVLNQDYSDRLHFIDAAGSNSPFIGHDICSNDPYFNGLILQDTTSSFHPNAAGQEAYADLVRDALGV